MRLHGNIQRFALVFACACAVALVCALAACSTTDTSSTSPSARQTASPSDTTTTLDVSKLKKDSDNVLESNVVEEIYYYSGIHHAELVFEGYEDQPITIEIYAHSAPQTAAKFCRLVDRGYYNGKPLFWILNSMYVRVGSPTQDNANLITGEYEESDVTNSNSLKRGVVAMNRAADGQQSDASSIIICMSDLSYLDKKYAGFAKITENYEVIEKLANLTSSSDSSKKITIDENGRINDETKYPHIQSITMVD
jgi:peptidyl-prolyl cis-trans isomerase B (cyclophilin B)